ncbi:MAG: hypothetical protein A2275_07260 [Bacteroidetes bacterium RIFOXYA12_FULL_35_11]|nr:MAG: hypothetical protein A2X01_02975 [Bacteroidetes bacterium GWF2_35_48]OFY72806.1 MAG: hypothetical protein A2275_07260 [Bacteroidetes bacterium RIFOXYA12_FULL_35_11]OFY95093.1 MAG: hypothetical protein A2491_18690 [Bacteroidetes bacterium RIFOXYC12_FULL_35_7]OFY96304.1 MAG: hypothetical protein A2309_14835 [Bacteroidetes bacterium RIFOXYB2_FULL_35_7]HBX52966.1 hypothetical protein [Bacteroidales bacterium]
MKIKIPKIFVISFIFLITLFTQQTKAQEDCSVLLKKAGQYFEEGAIDSVFKLIEPCIERGYDKKEKLQAYRLLTLVSLYQDNKKNAEKYIIKILETEPEYEVVRSVEEPEFLSIFDTYFAAPVSAYGVYIGTNFSIAKTIEHFGVHNLNNAVIKNLYGTGFQFGVKYSRFIYRNFDLNFDMQIEQNKLYNERYFFNFVKVECSETNIRLSAPVSVTYEYPYKKIKPYLRGGLNPAFLFMSNARLIRNFTDNSAVDVKGSEINMTDGRNPFNLWLVTGAGLKYKIKKGYLFIDFRYNLGLFNQVRIKNRYSNNELVYKYYYIDDDFRMNIFSISVGYTFVNYNPMKVK